MAQGNFSFNPCLSYYFVYITPRSKSQSFPNSLWSNVFMMEEYNPGGWNELPDASETTKVTPVFVQQCCLCTDNITLLRVTKCPNHIQLSTSSELNILKAKTTSGKCHTCCCVVAFPWVICIATEGCFSFPLHHTSLLPGIIPLLQMLDRGYIFLATLILWWQQPEITVH